MSPVLDVLFWGCLGAALVLFGRWGSRHTSYLAPRGLREDERDRRERVLARGAVACQVVGVIFLGAVVVSLLP